VTLRIKNWAKFQHFKDRRPPWVKLYRDLLDDIEWHQLEPRAAKSLVMLWLIASENEGELPAVETLAFRLRTSEAEVLGVLKKLSHWLIQDDIDSISERNQNDAPETEKRQRREETEKRARDFKTFYDAYPKKKSPADAEKAFAKVKVPIEVLLRALAEQRKSEDWVKENGRYIPYPASWLNSRGWENSTRIEVAEDPGEWHETKSGVEKRAAELGISPWDGGITANWQTYKARVMAAHQQGAH
jgi:hypothetical protein